MAHFGSAVEVSLHKSDMSGSRYALCPSFKNCRFVSNYRLEDVSKREHSANYSWGKGVLLVTGLTIMFSGKTISMAAILQLYTHHLASSTLQLGQM